MKLFFDINFVVAILVLILHVCMLETHLIKAHAARAAAEMCVSSSKIFSKHETTIIFNSYTVELASVV